MDELPVRIWIVSTHKLGGFLTGMWTSDPNEISGADEKYIRADLTMDLSRDRDYWREMYENTAEALRKTQDALLAATDGE